MAFFEWQESYSVGIAEIDEQHRQLIHLVNMLHGTTRRSEQLATLESVLDEFDVLFSVLNQLVDCTFYHFQAEAWLMAEHGFPEFETHRGEHARFGERIRGFQDTLAKSKTRLAPDVVEFIRDWWHTHALCSDKKCGAFICQRNHG